MPRLVHWCFCAPVCLLLGTTGASSQFPNRPIHLVVPYPPGGLVDTMARTVQEPLSAALGQPVIVDNKPGAAGAIATRFVAQSPPDGYTLIFGNNGPSALLPLIQKDAGYDPIADFTPITMVATAPMIIVIHENTPAKNPQGVHRVRPPKSGHRRVLHGRRRLAGSPDIRALCADGWHQARSHPLQRLGSGGHGGARGRSRRCTCRRRATRSAPASRPARSVWWACRPRPRPTWRPGPRRLPTRCRASTYRSGTACSRRRIPPGPIVERLNEAFREVLARPEIQARFQGYGAAARGSSPEELAKLIAEEVPKWRSTVESAQITAQ